MNSPLSTLLTPSETLDPPDRGRGGGGLVRLASALPWLLLLGFFGVLALMFGSRLIPAKTLTIATVVTVRQSADAVSETTAATPKKAEAQMLFQASGWVEPDPYPVAATALIDGILESVEVLEGERVEAGQLLATLIDDDAKLDLATAESQLDSLRAQCEAHLKQTAIVEAQQDTLSKQIAVAEARREEAADVAKRLESVSTGGVAALDLSKAQLEYVTAKAEVEALAVTGLELEARVEQLDEVQADFFARIAEAETDVARKRLTLDRTRIDAPIAGRVLRLHAAPGHKKMLGMDREDSATIAILYDPESLQARIDVPLAEAAQLTVGQPVTIRSELLPDRTFQGRVTRIVGEADLQRNTLQAKVAIEAPDERMRPEMLCRAEFFAMAPTTTATGPSTTTTGDRVRLFVPTSALPENAASQDEVTLWKVDASGEHVTPQPITLGPETREDHRVVLDGLKPGDRVVLAPPADLRAGDRFRPAKES